MISRISSNPVSFQAMTVNKSKLNPGGEIDEDLRVLSKLFAGFKEKDPNARVPSTDDLYNCDKDSLKIEGTSKKIEYIFYKALRTALIPARAITQTPFEEERQKRIQYRINVGLDALDDSYYKGWKSD